MTTRARSLKFYDGPEYIKDDVCLRYQYYTCPTDFGLVSAGLLSIMFTIDAPVRDIWPTFEDFNLWQNAYGYSYSGVIGELEGSAFQLDVGGKNDYKPYRYEVLRVIPEHLMVFSESVPPDGRTGGIKPGFHTFTLNEFGGRTVISYTGDHATRTQNKSEDEALVPWREFAVKVLPMWHDSFIPTLKKLVFAEVGTKE